MPKFIRVFAAIAAVFIIASCKKYSTGYTIIKPPPQRTIRFQLYTNKDFSEDSATVDFSVFIRDADHILFDSALAPLQLRDIPDSLHKLVIEKTVRSNADLPAGFRYEIDGVGTSAFIDTSRAGNPFKVIDYNFQ